MDGVGSSPGKAAEARAEVLEIGAGVLGISDEEAGL